MSLDAIWEEALGARVAHASWLVEEDGRVLAAHAPERMFSSASMVKTFVLAVAWDTGLDLAAPVEVAEDLRAPGDGVLGELTLPLALPLGDLLHLMIACSDNTATNAVLAALGGPEEVDATLAAWGYTTRVRRWLGRVRPHPPELEEARGDPALPSAAGLGVTSAAEHARVVAGLDADALAPLLAQHDRLGLARPFGGHVPFAHKTGSVDRVRHDGGVLLAGDRRISVHAFTDGGPEDEWPDHPALVGMGEAMARMARALGVRGLAPQE